MHARQWLMGIAAALAFGLVLLQAPGAAAAEEKKPSYIKPGSGDDFVTDLH